MNNLWAVKTNPEFSCRCGRAQCACVWGLQAKTLIWNQFLSDSVTTVTDVHIVTHCMCMMESTKYVTCWLSNALSWTIFKFWSVTHQDIIILHTCFLNTKLCWFCSVWHNSSEILVKSRQTVSVLSNSDILTIKI